MLGLEFAAMAVLAVVAGRLLARGVDARVARHSALDNGPGTD